MTVRMLLRRGARASTQNLQNCDGCTAVRSCMNAALEVERRLQRRSSANMFDV